MPPPARTSEIRRLHARRASLGPDDLEVYLGGTRDPLALGPLAAECWRQDALLVPVERLRKRAAARIAAGFLRRPRDGRWTAWMTSEVAAAAARLRAESPTEWRPTEGSPSVFEQAVAGCFGVRDRHAAALIARFHRLPSADRRALHKLLPHHLLGVERTAAGPPNRSRTRSRVEARRALSTLRRLVASVQRDG